MAITLTTLHQPILKEILNFLTPQELNKNKAVCKIFYILTEEINNDRIRQNHSWLNKEKFTSFFSSLSPKLYQLFRYCCIWSPHENCAIISIISHENTQLFVQNQDKISVEKQKHDMRIKRLNSAISLSQTIANSSQFTLTQRIQNLDQQFGGQSFISFKGNLTQLLQHFLSCQLTILKNEKQNFSETQIQAIIKTYENINSVLREIPHYHSNQLDASFTSFYFNSVDPLLKLISNFLKPQLLREYESIIQQFDMIKSEEEKATDLSKERDYLVSKLKVLNETPKEFPNFLTTKFKALFKELVDKIKHYEDLMLIGECLRQAEEHLKKIHVNQANLTLAISWLTKMPKEFYLRFCKELLNITINIDDVTLEQQADLFFKTNPPELLEAVSSWVAFHETSYDYESEEISIIEAMKDLVEIFESQHYGEMKYLTIEGNFPYSNNLQ